MKGLILFLILFPWLTLIGIGLAGYEIVVAERQTKALSVCIEGAPGCPEEQTQTQAPQEAERPHRETPQNFEGRGGGFRWQPNPEPRRIEV